MTDQPAIGIRTKLILLFVVIKIVPLVLLAWFAWNLANNLGSQLSHYSEDVVNTMRGVVAEGGKIVIGDATKALDTQARDAIEHLTTETARHMARFLYDRDNDIQFAATLPPGETAYRQFLTSRRGLLIQSGPFVLTPDQTAWIEQTQPTQPPTVQSSVRDNDRDFHARPMDQSYGQSLQPLYTEMTFVDLTGREVIRVTADGRSAPLRDVSRPENTYVRAETYFPDLQRLKPGEIHVSRVVGAYVRSQVIGPYTPAAADKAGIAFAPQDSAFAGRENPAGKRFQGIIRWAAPVTRDGRIIGYVTMALDHRHVMEFTDVVVPTDERLRGISDATQGNYAMAYDYEGRNIAHPRHYTIVGHDPETGRLVAPWLDGETYQAWQASGLAIEDFLHQTAPYQDPSLHRKPSKDQIAQGTLAVYCGYSNFAPQCAGWRDLTARGGSGSFLLYWSGLWKLSTAASIPYYTGQYGRTPVGFGWVSMTANLDEFHRAATESKARIQAMMDERQMEMEQSHAKARAAIDANVRTTLSQLLGSTTLMIVVVIGVAIWMASLLSSRVHELIAGIRRMEQGETDARLPVHSRDELGQVAASFNVMADRVSHTLQDLAVKNSELQKIAYAASHDFQEPLRSIVSFSQMVQRRYAQQLDQDADQYLDFVVQSALRMKRLVEDLRAFVEVISEPPHCCPLNSDDVVRDVVAGFTDRLHAIGGTITVSPLPQVIADGKRLSLLIGELLDNAIRYRRTDTPLEIIIGVQRTLTHWEFVIADNGVGIETDYLTRIFSLFEKMPSQEEGMGTGIGLALCQKLLHSQGGDIQVESTPGRGSTFRFTLPALDDI